MDPNELCSLCLIFDFDALSLFFFGMYPIMLPLIFYRHNNRLKHASVRTKFRLPALCLTFRTSSSSTDRILGCRRNELTRIPVTMTRRRPQHIPPLPDFPSVEQCVAESTEIWARDLRSLFEHAKERFGDVSWESEGSEDVQRIWGHKGES